MVDDAIDNNTTRKLVLVALDKWNFNKIKANPYNISRKIGRSESSVIWALRRLKDDEIVKKSVTGSWHF